MTGESSAKPLPRKGALRKKKRKVTYLEDSVGSTGDEYDLKAVNIKGKFEQTFNALIHKNFVYQQFLVTVSSQKV